MRIQWLAVLLVAGCSAETVAQPPPPPVNWSALAPRPLPEAGADFVSARERELPSTYAAALGSEKLAQLGPMLDDDAHFASPGMEDGHGKGSVVHAHEALFGAFDQRKVTVGRVLRTPTQQTIEWTMNATHARDWMGVAATHKPVAFKGATLLWTKDDGSVADVHVYVDVAVVKAQLGVGPKELLALPPATPPTAPPQVIEKTGSGEEDMNLRAVRASLEALESNDEAAYLSTMADDVEVNTAERVAPAHGKADAKAYFKAMHKAIGQLDTTADSAIGIGSFVVVEYSIAGEQMGPVGWIPAQRDKVIRLQTVDVVEVHAGKLARIWRYDDPAQITAR
jgi:ketosteroid isomerase-like protein